MQVLLNFLEWLFSSKKTFVYSTFAMDDYYKAVGKLKASGVKYRVAAYAQSSPANWGQRNNEYKIYVKKEDEHRALEAIHHK